MHSLSEQILYLPTRLMTNNALCCNYPHFQYVFEVTELNIRQLNTDERLCVDSGRLVQRYS